MAIDPLDSEQEGKTEKWLNDPKNAPEVITRYGYNAKDVKGIRYVESPMFISGGLKYIREDLIQSLRPGTGVILT